MPSSSNTILFAISILVVTGCSSSKLAAIDAGESPIQIVENEDSVDINTPPGELPVSPSRGFRCDPSAVGQMMTVAELEGAVGERVVITPAEECTFWLSFQGSDGALAPLSTDPGGYLIVAAARFEDQTALICASNVAHEAVGTDPGERQVESVSVQCWADLGEGFGTPIEVLAGAPDWAGWVRSVAKDSANTFSVTFVHDFTFQFLNFSDNGRPPDDGVYTLALSIPEASSISVLTTTKISDVTNPAAEVEQVGWTPTEEEKQAFSGFMDFDEGACPEGCSVDVPDGGTLDAGTPDASASDASSIDAGT